MSGTPLRDTMIKALSGGRSVSRSSFGAMLESIIEQAGSIRKAAPLLGVHNTTLSRWRRGATPKQQAANMAKVQNTYISQNVRQSVVDRWRRDDIHVTVHGVPGKGSGTRDLNSRQLQIVPGTGNKIVNAFMAGNFGAMAGAFRSGIGDDWYREVMFGDWMDDDDLRGEEAHDAGDYEVSVGSAS